MNKLSKRVGLLRLLGMPVFAIPHLLIRPHAVVAELVDAQR